MDLMTRAPSDITLRMHCRHEIVTTDGIDGVCGVATVLRQSGYRVRDFSADVREGVVLSSLTCTVSLTPDEPDDFADLLAGLPTVVSVNRC